MKIKLCNACGKKFKGDTYECDPCYRKTLLEHLPDYPQIEGSSNVRNRKPFSEIMPKPIAMIKKLFS